MEEKELHGIKRTIFVWTLLAGTFTMSISQSSLSTAYPTLMHYFGVDAPTIQWLTTGFMLIMCVMMPLSPWLLNNFSFKKIYLSVLLIFMVGTVMIIMAPNFILALLGRALEAVAVGVLFPSFQTVLLTITPVKKRPSVMGLAGLVMGSALACGPIISGIILNYLSWQSLFGFFLFVIAIVFVSALFNIYDVLPRQHSGFDFISVIASFGLIGILYVVQTYGSKLEMTPALLVLLILSLAFTAYFIYRQFTLKEPLLKLRVMRVVNFDLAVLLTGIAYISLIVVTVVYPLYYQKILHTSVLVSGLALVPPAILLSILNPLTGKLTEKIGFKKTLLIGMAMLVCGWGALVVFAGNLTLVSMIIFAMLIEGGNAFVMMPATTLGANSLAESQISHGTAIITTVRQLLGALGVTVATLILAAGSGSISSVNGYRNAFIFFCLLEIIGFILACAIRQTKDNK
ncbi:MFS transporter [Liquorilactobacillus capillatus]|nr:MFS transporter [Liquorilactobacillus capillatus]